MSKAAGLPWNLSECLPAKQSPPRQGLTQLDDQDIPKESRQQGHQGVCQGKHTASSVD